jgi:protein-S-isoprenylcysteine O-methyltransferase Ste14
LDAGDDGRRLRGGFFADGRRRTGAKPLAAEKRVATAGIYGHVRHPLFAPGFMLTAGAALMLCFSVVSFFASFYFAAVVVRTLCDVRFLGRNMYGSMGYVWRTKRCLPGII